MSFVLAVLKTLSSPKSFDEHCDNCILNRFISFLRFVTSEMFVCFLFLFFVVVVVVLSPRDVRYLCVPCYMLVPLIRKVHFLSLCVNVALDKVPTQVLNFPIVISYNYFVLPKVAL